ncbi:hypothetical protein [Streptomyces sp. NPDC050264]|uniref:hypothetical protein n=1 Tax=Streptomyces sp. NPDC050264 TaxID=3155038 RepID=UPI00342B7132
MTPDAPDAPDPRKVPAHTTSRPPVTRETPERAAARYPEIARHFEEFSATDSMDARRLLWREAAVIVVVVALLIVRALWFL